MSDVQERSKGESSLSRSDVPLSPDAQVDGSSSHTPTEQGDKRHKEERQPKKKKKKKKDRSDSEQDEEKSLESEEYLSKDIEKLLKKKEALMKILNLLLKQKNTVLDQQHDAMTNFKGSRENLKTILDQNVSMVNEIGNQITTINGKVEKVNIDIKRKQQQLKKKTSNAATKISESQCSTTGKQENTKLSSKDKTKSTPHDKQKKDKLLEERKGLSDSYSKKDISALVCEKESKTPSSKEAILNSQVNYECEKEQKKKNSKCIKSVGSEIMSEVNPSLLTESVGGGSQEEDLPVAEVLCLLNDEDIVRHQSSDSILQTLWDYAESGQVFTRGTKTYKYQYVTIHSRLYRKVTYHTGEVRNLFVVPTKFREAVFELAHQSPLGGHYDKKKTFKRLHSFFFWPAHQEYVHKQWSLCEKCQEPEDKKQGNPQTVFAEPFEKIGVDIVGPMFRKSSDDYEYILYVLDLETRWVEAVALKTINKENVAEALLEILYRVGIPKELLSDCGSQFTLPMMNEVLEHLSAKGLRTVLYHPMCNDLVSKIGGNLPMMFLRMVVDQPDDWPRYLTPLIYAYLQTPQSSSKLSPFDIAFGEMTRESFPGGSLEILREIWDGNIISPVVKLSYFNMLTLKYCLKETCKIGKQQLPKTPIMGKVVPDPNFVPRRFKIGDQCLIFQPTKNNKLQTSWDGPHTVVEGNGPLCWKIGNKKCWSSYHINMLKKYEKTVSCANVQSRLSQDQLEYLDLIRMHYSECRMPCSVPGEVDSSENLATARGAAVNPKSSASHESSGVTLNTRKLDSQAGVSSHSHTENKNPSQKTVSLECLKEIEVDSTKETKKLIMYKAKSEPEVKELEDGELEEGELEDD